MSDTRRELCEIDKMSKIEANENSTCENIRTCFMKMFDSQIYK